MTNNNTDQTEKEVGLKLLKFSVMGIPNGAELVYRHDGNEYKAKVVSDRKVLFDGEEISLSDATRKIKNKNINYHPNPIKHWYYNERLLADIYCEIYNFFILALQRFKSEMNHKSMKTKKGNEFVIDVDNDKIYAIPESTQKSIPVTNEQILGFLEEKIRSRQRQHLSYAPVIAEYIKTHYITRNTQGDPPMTDDLTQNLTNLLKSTRNIILHGAPGTGKTHLAREIAEAMGCSENEVGFVQFHPSYDYTDFVEGLRPVNNGDGQVGFERKDGVFKKFCERAILKNFKKSIPVTRIQDSSFNSVYKSLLDDVKSGKITSYTTSQSSYPLRLTEDGRLLYKEKSPRTESKENMRLMYDYFLNEGIYDLSNYDKDKYWDLISKLTNGRTSRIDYSEYGWTLQVLLDRAKKIEKEKQNDYEELEVQVLENENDNTPFVFIIDEINRGDMSKIFGELFFAIEPGYRGAEKCNSLRTQYANLQSEPNAFDEVLKITDSDNFGHFFIPENVYIIGTMNDIDRGVESMDFAFRRRFTFVEVKAGDRIEMLDELDDGIREEAKSRMHALNNAIWNEKTHSGIDGLSSAYHIGGAYFLKLKELDNDFDKLWEYHLAPLLKEYLRGMENEDEKFDALKKAYTLGE